MREIIFRGKRCDNGEWVYGDLLQGVEGDYYIIVTTENGFTKYEVQADTVGQYTGLKDKNGNKIWEGDIVRVRVTNDRFTRNPRFEIGSVKYDDYYGRWHNGFLQRFFSKRMEVIGNIIDNPELLKGGAE